MKQPDKVGTNVGKYDSYFFFFFLLSLAQSLSLSLSLSLISPRPGTHSTPNPKSNASASLPGHSTPSEARQACRIVNAAGHATGVRLAYNNFSSMAPSSKEHLGRRTLTKAPGVWLGDGMGWEWSKLGRTHIADWRDWLDWRDWVSQTRLATGRPGMRPRSLLAQLLDWGSLRPLVPPSWVPAKSRRAHKHSTQAQGFRLTARRGMRQSGAAGERLVQSQPALEPVFPLGTRPSIGS